MTLFKKNYSIGPKNLMGPVFSLGSGETVDLHEIKIFKKSGPLG